MKRTLVAAILMAAFLYLPGSATAHVIFLGKTPAIRAAKKDRMCDRMYTVRQFKHYASRVYHRGKISDRASKRIRQMHICQETFQERIRVGHLHSTYYQARKERMRYVPSGGILYAIRVCETGGDPNNYTLSTGNGFYGPYQFTLQTWIAYGGSGYPHQNPPAEQDRVAMNLYRAHGVHTSASWPNCP